MKAGLLHLNTAGAGLPSPAVRAAIVQHLELEARMGPYEAQAFRHAALAGVYEAVARLINATADEIALAPGGGAAWNAAFYGLPLVAGDRILTTTLEYGGAVAAMLHRRRRDGIELDVAPPGPNGRVDLDRLEAMVCARTRVICLTWIPTHTGIVEPAKAIGRIARRHGLLFVVDAAQALGQRPVDVARMGCDVLAASGRKFLGGPRGSGILFVRRGVNCEPVQVDHWIRNPCPDGTAAPDPTGAARFELWERSPALQLGLGCAVKQALAGDPARARPRSEAAGRRFREGLRGIRGVTVADPAGAEAPIVAFSMRGGEAETCRTALAGRGVNVSIVRPRSSPWAGGLFTTERLRASFSDAFDDDMVDEALERIASLAGETR